MTVSLEAVRQAVAAERMRAVDIIELCQAAGRMNRAESFINSDLSASAVRRDLAQRAPVAEPQQHRAAFDPAAIEAALLAERRLH